MPELIVRYPARIYDVCWARDGEAVFATTDLGGAHYDLWKIPLADPLRGSTKISFGQADEDRPSVSQDGRWLLYTDNRAGATALVRCDLTSGGEQMVTAAALDFAKPTGSVRLKTVQQGSDEPIVARVSIEQQ